MDPINYIFGCDNADCQGIPGAEAQVHQQGDRFIVICGLCNRLRGFKKDRLSRKKPWLMAEDLRGYFTVAERYTQ